MAPGDCCIPPPPSQYEGTGAEEKWDGLDVYATGLPTSSSAILFICDIYGWEVPQSRYLADKLAASGHYVILPDFLEKDYFNSSSPVNPHEGLPEWLNKHSKPKAIEIAAKLIEQLHSKAAKKVGVMGNCWGAKITVSLLFGDKGTAAGLMNHPSFLTHEEIRSVKVPLAILGAEMDFITPPELAKEFGEILAKSPEVGDKSFVKIFEGVEHGWTTRYDTEDKTASQKAEEAHQEAISFFQKYLQGERDESAHLTQVSA